MITKITEAALLRALERTRHGGIRLHLPNGSNYEFQGDGAGPQAEITVHSADVLLNLLKRGDVGLCEDYRAGRWDSPDPALVVEFGLRNIEALSMFSWGSPIFRLLSRFSYLRRRNSPGGSRENIYAHYDLGNDFYSLWLDDSMTYSAAIFESERESLESAQARKYDRILNLIGREGGPVLEIGCGWGGFAERLAQNSARDLSSITISPAQHSYAKHRVVPYGERVDVKLQDYRDVSGKYSSIVSIEMFEAVGEEYWQGYFQRLSGLLLRGGRAVVQTITIGDNYFEEYRRCADMFRTYIFPGGLLPSAERFAEEAGRAGLRISDTYSFGEHYAKTCEEWRKRFQAKEREVSALGFDESFRRLWSFYLSACIGAFRAGRIDVQQLELQHA